MVLLDSNIFIIDRFFPRDAVYSKNRAFVDQAENYGPQAIITWNTKDFSGRTRLPVLTPTAFMRRH